MYTEDIKPPGVRWWWRREWIRYILLDASTFGPLHKGTERHS
jgi:hypothetical protein